MQLTPSAMTHNRITPAQRIQAHLGSFKHTGSHRDYERMKNGLQRICDEEDLNYETFEAALKAGIDRIGV